MKAFKLAVPTTVNGAHLASRNSFGASQFLAGGTDLVAMLKERGAAPDVVVNLKNIAGLSAITESADAFTIGALVTLDDLQNHAGIAKAFPAIATTVSRSATPQVRNTATVAGNLCQRPRCSYFRHEYYSCAKSGGQGCPAREGEHEHHAIFENGTCSAPHPSNLAPVLIAYGATMTIKGPKEERTIEVEDFFRTPKANVQRENQLAPKDLVTKIVLPKANASKNSAYVEARQKQSFDWALVGATATLAMDGRKVKSGRIVLNAVAPTPLRRVDLEKMIVGKTLNDALIAKVCDAAISTATPLANNGYKSIMLKAVLKRALRQAKEA